jgi:hypothetical protein
MREQVDTWLMWPEWESLNYVALHAYERATGEDGLDALPA